VGGGTFATVEDGLAVVLELAPVVRADPGTHQDYQQLRRDWEAVRDRVLPSLNPLAGATP
jgi:hypothetical protein